MLDIRDLNVSYGPIQAVFDLSLSVARGAIVALLGANGAGKSTTVRAIGGLTRAQSGVVEVAGKPLGASGPEHRVALGIALVTDDRLLFPNLSVKDNLRVGGHRLRVRELNERLEVVFEMFPALAQGPNRGAGALSGGQAQMLAIGRALMTAPKVLALDEPSQGLAPQVVAELFQTISRLSSDLGIAILLVEQNAALALEYATHGYVLDNGRLSLSAPASELLLDRQVQRLYLGE